MIRLTILFVFLVVLIIYSWKDWYKSLCGLIIFMAVLEHPDMPKSIMGIQGMNPWNVTFFFIALAWFFSRGKEGLRWDMPRHMTILLFLYFAVILVSFTRLLGVADRLIAANPEGQSLLSVTKDGMISEYLINNIKWMIPGLLLFDGCRSRSRLEWALAALLGIYLMLGLQVIKWMPLGEVTSGDTLSARSLKIIKNEIGYHRVNLSMMLAGASWAIFAFSKMPVKRMNRILVFISGLVVLFAQALTGGRAGYATWGVVGLILCTIRWKKLLLLAPVAVLLVVTIVPGVRERMMQGFTPESKDTNPLVAQTLDQQEDEPDLYTITAGRNVAWPYVIEKIKESPLFGHGRQAMITTGIAVYLWERYREIFFHPHNAYLEMLLDNGFLGFILVIPLYLIILKYAFSLFRDSRSMIFVSTGGVAAALVLALMVASVGSQSFYPREGSVGMWCSIFLMVRVFVERARADSEGGEGGVNGDIFQRAADPA